MSAKYPLAPLARVRESKVDAATLALTDAVRTREAAEVQRRDAEGVLAQALREAEEVRHLERAALDRHELSVSDLARRDAWEHRIERERVVLEDSLFLAREAEAAANVAEAAARRDVLLREADAGVVEKDHQRWRVAEGRRAEARDEEGAAEAWRPRREG